MAFMINDKEECFLCGSGRDLEKHHLLHGSGRRKLADEDGLILFLCHHCHMELHDHGKHDLELQQYAQRYYEEHLGSRDDFMNRYGKSYI